VDFKVMPRLGAVGFTSKFNAFYAVDPNDYDVLFFMDCDTFIAKPLDAIIDPIKYHKVDFLCRRGGETERNNTFRDLEKMVARFCEGSPKTKIIFDGKEEWPMFNSGVFLATPEAVCRIRKYAVEFTYQLFNEWKVNATVENIRFIKYLFNMNLLKRRTALKLHGYVEQGALALACIKAGVNVQYLDEAYNSWGNHPNFKILHCFKSLYKFDRNTMFTDEAKPWIEEYLGSDIPGKKILAEIINMYKNVFT